MTGLLRRAWMPIVMVVVTAVGGFAVSQLREVFGGPQYVPDTGHLEAVVSFNPKRVLYEVFGPVGETVTITYLDAEAQPHEQAHATLPWSLLIETNLTSVSPSIVAQGDADAIGCRITVNDIVRDERSVAYPYAQTSCLVKSA